MIPEAAVEAAITEAESCGHDDIPHYLFRAILEAAAPHMLAGAWDAGHDACADELAKYENPYRPTP